jgi:hypothetical protein
MLAPNPLRDAWLRAMRASTTRAIGRECDYAMSEGDVDKFDPIGLLAILRDPTDLFDYFRTDGSDGAYVPQYNAEHLASAVDFPPSHLYTLCLMNDEGMSWGDIAAWAERMCITHALDTPRPAVVG